MTSFRKKKETLIVKLSKTKIMRGLSRLIFGSRPGRATKFMDRKKNASRNACRKKCDE